MPLLPIAAKLKQDAKCSVFAVTDKTGSFAHVLEQSKDIDKVFKISGGKYRRYPNESKLKQLLDVKTHALNLRDLTRNVSGLSQAIRLLSKQRPDVIFIKGGFVSVPVGIAARIKGVPFVTHDSDAVPSLVTKIIGKWASERLSGMPAKQLHKGQSVRHVGVPVSDKFHKILAKEQDSLKQKLKIPTTSKLVFVTGGSQGAARINDIVSSVVDVIARDSVFVVHQTGPGKVTDSPENQNYKKIAFIENMSEYSGAADVIVSRTGSSLAEFAQQNKPVITIPAKHLAGGHQLFNAEILKDNEAAVVLDEDELLANPELLIEAITDVLDNKSTSEILAKRINKVYPGDATEEITKAILRAQKAKS